LAFFDILEYVKREFDREGKETFKAELDLGDEKDLSSIYERLNKSLKIIEDVLGVEASIRGSKIFIQGRKDAVNRAERLIREIYSFNSNGLHINPEDLKFVLRAVDDTDQDVSEPPHDGSIRDYFLSNIPVSSSKKKFILPRSEGQKEYVEAIRENDLVIGIGPAGTGKTYLAMAMAVNALVRKQVSRIILARPAVEAGERLGFLPGDLYEKVNPYLRPLYDALFDMMEAERAARLIEKGIIEIAPLAFMRGRTLNDSFIILDEAQNTTSEQMKMFLTRLGFNSKAVVTGDITQIDLPPEKTSGLVEAEEILRGIEGIKFVYFSERDVVRHKLVQRIVRAYEEYDRSRNKRQ